MFRSPGIMSMLTFDRLGKSLENEWLLVQKQKGNDEENFHTL